MKLLLTADPELPVPPVHYGGIERIVDGLARELRSRNHQIGLVAHEDSECAVDTLYEWPGKSSLSRIDTFYNTIKLVNAFSDFKPDIIHSYSRLAYLLPFLPLSIPKIMSYQRHTGGRQAKIASILAGESLKFTGCSEFICEQGRKSGGSWHAIHNFVDVDRFTFQEKVSPEAPLVFLSRIESIKGADIAIEIAKLTGRRLLLAGNYIETGHEYDFWQTKIKPQLNNRIEWVGEVNDVQKIKLLGEAAAMIVPIQWDEPFGIVFAEALACGTPVISFCRGALPEIIRDGVEGFFINNIEEGRVAVEKINSISRIKCRHRAEKHFSVKIIVDKYEAMYRSMLEYSN